MKKLNLPIIRKPLPEPKWLSMNDYLKFVNLHLKHAFDRKSNRNWKKMSAVNAPFLLK